MVDQLWKGRQSGPSASILVRMGQSIDLDIKLFRQDILGSRAHTIMLHSIGVLSQEESQTILAGLRQIAEEIEAGTLPLRAELEDIHTHVENRLIELTGEAGRKLHTARSRNDQIALDTHLYVRDQSVFTCHSLLGLLAVILKRSEEHRATILPGYTHLQIGQPVRLSHHLLAYFWKFLRDFDRFFRAMQTANRLPLGSGALAGVNYPVDREMVQKKLGFSELYENSMDAVSSRDHILEFLFAASVLAVNASRLAEEMILWMSSEFQFLELPDSLTTGSSIMPQKKNPDLAELVRGKSGRFISHLQNLLINLKGLPLTYNRDLQEDRFPLTDTAEQLELLIEALGALLEQAQFRPENMQKSLEAGFATATDLADALVKEHGIPFRDAHHITGRLISYCLKNGKVLQGLETQERAAIHGALTNDAFYFRAISLEASTEKKISRGGTAQGCQEMQTGLARIEFEKRSRISWPGPAPDLL
ncbi:MAG: argininosuccinate lyase [Spirochaetales bacterium]|nr:argininosuccinate lyase [Spirochaetales bacterium]